MRELGHIERFVLLALTLAGASCADAEVPQGAPAPTSDALDVPSAPVADVAPDTLEVTPEVSPDVSDVVEVAEVIEEVTQDEVVEVADEPDAAPCEPGIDPEDPCWYCKCEDDGQRKCFPLGSGSSCKSSDCCVINPTCQPCETDLDQPCGKRSAMVCTGGPALSCDSDDPCTSSVLECVGSACQCTPSISPPSTPCKVDPDLCTTGDHCLDGTCVVGAPTDKDDGNPCTMGTCIKGEVVQLPLKGSCSDGNACTVNDQCQAGVCTSGPPAVCLQSACDATAECDPVQGCVTTPKPTGSTCSPSGGDGCGICNGEGWCQTDGDSCDDGNFCTNTVCIGNDDCIFVPNDNPCDDGNPCTWGDYCEAGFCHSGDAVPCGDLNPCTTDVCDGGACVNTPNANLCNDDNPCTVEDTCQVALPPCPGPFGQPLVLHHVLIQGWLVLIRYSTVYTDCLDLKNMAGQPIVSQMCETGECVDVEIPTSSFTGAMGDNVRVCLSNSGICSGTVLVDQPSGEGYCAGTPAAQLLCDDKDFCTTDSCDPIEGCVHTPIEPCGDMTLIYDDTSVSDTVDGEGCDGVQSQIQCLSGSVAVGYGGKSGQYLDEFRLRCRHLYGDGTLGASSMTAPLGAGLAGDDFGPLSCPGDAVMVGATVHAASNLHSVHGHCQAPMSVATGVEGFVAFAPQAGGAGGAASAVNCPVGYAVTGMKGPSTDQACSLQFICTRIDLL